MRVGLEDTLYLPDGAMARSNGELVAKARQMTEDVGRRPATVREARGLLNIPSAMASSGVERVLLMSSLRPVAPTRRSARRRAQWPPIPPAWTGGPR